MNPVKSYKAFLIAVIAVSVVSLALGLVLSVGSVDAASKHLFWLQVISIFAILVGMGAVLWYDHGRIRSLQLQLSEQTKKLRKSEEEYRSLVESAEDFIFTINRSGRFQSLNNFTANFFGGTPSQFLGQPLSVLFSEEIASQQLKLIEVVFEFGKSVRDEFMVTTGGHTAWLGANLMPLKDEQGLVTSVLCIARDITENKKLEKQLVDTEKLASMGTLAAGVAHELNNPLGIILGFTDLLLEKFDKNSQDHNDLETIERHSLHCKQVVENLLSFARQEEAVSEYCDINEDIKNIIMVVGHYLDMNDIELRLDLASGLPGTKGDSRQMQQVLLNLINNAVAAMKGGGILDIKTAFDARQDKVRVTVGDTGHGIKKEYIDNIFDPFFTTKSEGEGTGLGLFVSHGIVTKYGGTITCESSTEDTPQLRRGTIFTMTLKPQKGDEL
jgi:two-component system NtrC family sensor kinase